MPITPASTAVSSEMSSLQRQEDEAYSGKQALLAAEPSRLAQQRTEREAADAALGQREADAAGVQERQVDLPAQPGPLKIDPKEYEGLSYALIGMALIGGAASHGNFMGASAALNGALKGFHEGKTEQAKEQWDQYKQKFASAVEERKSAYREYEQTMKNKNLSINQQLAKIKTIAAQHHDQDMMIAAQEKRYDTVIQQMEAHKTSLANVVQRHEDITVRIDAQAARAGGRGRTGPQTDAGNELASMILERGGQVSYFGGKGPAYDRMAERALSEGKTLAQAADAVLSGKITLAADTRVATTTAVRQAAVKRLTETVTGLEDRVTELAKKNGNLRNPNYNLAMNALTKRFGSEKGQADLQELKTLMGSVGRLYQEAVTMPGSNAQMHATAQAWADGNFNESMSLSQIVGAIRGMNLEIQKTEQALGRSKDEAERKEPAKIVDFGSLK